MFLHLCFCGRVLQLGIQLEQCFEEVAIVCTRKGGIWSEVVGRDDEHIRIIDIPRQLRRVEEAVVQHQGHVEPVTWIHHWIWGSWIFNWLVTLWDGSG